MRTLATLAALLLTMPAFAAGPPTPIDATTAPKALAVLKAHCWRCHGQDGSVEGGLNFVLDLRKLVERRKVVPGSPATSGLLKRMTKGTMPPPDEPHRPTAADIAVVEAWIAAGAPVPDASRGLIDEASIEDAILADLDTIDRRARRFVRYFSLVAVANAGAGPDELATQRNAVTKLLNSLSWHPKTLKPTAVGPRGLLLRFDLRDLLWDANSWNRLLNEYPYGVLRDSAISRAILISTGTRMPVVRADWFVANASRAPLYYDLLQIPSNLGELERQLRVDVEANIRQERVARAGFNGSGISRNNRVLERHDAMNGAYWRTYDFEAVPANLLERNILAPDRRNLFAYPLGPGGAETQFQHAGGEVIFNLPNGLQAYVLINAANQRINKGPQDIVSDPRRPDRAVEAGLSCMHCHARGIIPKDDQIRDHVKKNAKAFARADIDLVEGLYVPAKKMRALMDEDAKRHQLAVERTGNRADAAEVVLAMTLRHEADIDLPTLAAEVGVTPEAVLGILGATENLSRNLGALKVAGGTVSRQVAQQSFGDLVRGLKLGTPLEVGRAGETLPDATGEADPLEAQSAKANAVAFHPTQRLAAFAGADRSVILFDLDAGREVRRFIGHTASVWAVAFSPDGSRLASGGKDGRIRIWDTETAREQFNLDGHRDLVSAVAFSPDGKRLLSAGFDHEAMLWDAERGVKIESYKSDERAKWPTAVAFAPDGKRVALAAGRSLLLADAASGKVAKSLSGHAGWLTSVTFAGDDILTTGDDGTARLWVKADAWTPRVYRGHVGSVRAATLSPDKRHLATAGSDATVRLYETATAKELKAFGKHRESVAGVRFITGGKATESLSRGGDAERWNVAKLVVEPEKPATTPVVKPVIPTPTPDDGKTLRPAAVLPVGGTVGKMILSRDGRSLYVLDRTHGRLLRIDAVTLERTATAELGTAADAIAVSPDGKRLAAVGADRGPKAASLLLWFDPATLSQAGSLQLPFAAYDVAVDDGGTATVSDATEGMSKLYRFDLSSGKEAAAVADIRGRSLLEATPSGDVVISSADGLERIGRDGKRTRAKAEDKRTPTGPFAVTADGAAVVFRSGSVRRLDATLSAGPWVERHLSSAIDAKAGVVYLLTGEGSLVRYAYPEMKRLDAKRPALAGYHVAVEPKSGRVFVAGFDARSVGDDPRAKGYGDVHVYETSSGKKD